MTALGALGCGLYLPLGENTRCDLVIEREGRLERIQIKTGRLRLGAVVFRVCSSYAHHPNPKILRRTYDGDIDFFGVFCRESGRVYLVPIADVPTRNSAALRVDPPRNNQLQKVRWARDYEIGTVAIGGLRAPSGA
jgi:PD-(D/E)XK endonuclease